MTRELQQPKSYEMPQVEVVEMSVEKGFASSYTGDGGTGENGGPVN